MQSEPVGSVVGALARRRRTHPAGGERRLRRGRRRGGVPPLQQPRLRPARRGGGPDPRRVLVGRRGDHDPGAARDDPHDLPPAGAVGTGLQRRPLHRHPHPRAAPGHRRDGTGRPGVEHDRRPRPLGPGSSRSVTPRCSTSRPSARRPTPRHRAPEYGLGLRLVPWHGRFLVGHTGSMPGFVASLFVDPLTGDGSVVLANATTGLDTDGVPALLLGSDDVEAAAAVGPDRGRCRTRSPTCSACGSGGTPRSSCAGTRIGLGGGSRCTAWRCRTVRTSSRSGTGGSSASRATTAARPCTSYAATTAAISHLDCATFVYTKVPYDPDVPIPGGHPTD